VVVFCTLVAAFAYGGFVLNPSRHGDWIPYCALVAAELILLLNAVGMWWTALHAAEPAERPDVAAFRATLRAGRAVPSVDVLITVCGEPIVVVEATVRAARDMQLAHRVWVCDDGPSDEVAVLCAELGVGYLRRNSRKGVKAGNANHALSKTGGEFVAIFDADHVPHPDFLLVMLPHLARPDVAFVQGPQYYGNSDASFSAAASSESQRLFYEVICPGKNRFNAAFHVGTNAVFRRSALDDVEGFYEDTHSEDIWTSVRLHQRGWRSIYLPEIVAQGLAPETVYAHLRQQFRWASGSFEILLRSNPLRRKDLTADQRVQYLFPPLHFLLGFSNLWFLLLPPLFLLVGITPLEADSGTWLAWFLPFYLLTQLVLWLQCGGFRPKPIILSVATAPVHLKAFFAVLLRREPVWKVTNTGSAPPPPSEFLVPQIGLLLLNAAAIVVGLAVVENAVTTSITVALCLLHVGILGRVIVAAMLDRSRAEDRLTSPAARAGTGAAASDRESDREPELIDLTTASQGASSSATR
jgi:cellulose synthase (UDP-forming)